MTKLYPLKFVPIIKERIWGGSNLHKLLNKNINGYSRAGESWELSAVSGNISVVANGEYMGQTFNDVIAEFKGALLGGKVYEKFGVEFPLLVKLIDAQDDLSVQVHPNDIIAKKHHDGFGKTEMWYVMNVDGEASLFSGFTEKIDVDLFNKKLTEGSLLDILARHKVKKGDAFYIPAGRVHAIGKGILIAEIQQTSDITYRIYDYDRVGDDGSKRELHLDMGSVAIDFADTCSGYLQYDGNDKEAELLVDSPYFKTNIRRIFGSAKCDYSALDSFVILVNVEGDAEIFSDGVSYDLKHGETILIPADTDTLTIESENAKLLEVFL